MIDESKVGEISDLIKQPIKEIRTEGQVTHVEFMNGQVLQLQGGNSVIENLKDPVHECSFCGHIGTKEKPVVSLTKEDFPLICSGCATNAIETFINGGVEIEIDASIFGNLIEKLNLS